MRSNDQLLGFSVMGWRPSTVLYLLQFRVLRIKKNNRRNEMERKRRRVVRDWMRVKWKLRARMLGLWRWPR